MVVYLDAVFLLNGTIDFLLMLSANRLCGYPSSVKRLLLAAMLGGIYGGACILPGFSFLGGIVWRLVALGLMAWIAFGSGVSALRRGALFVLLSMALGGIALGLTQGGMTAILLGIGCILFLCFAGFGGQPGAKYVPVELHHTDRTVRLTALVDTGNTLRDPITGCPVLVVGAQVARQLLGLTEKQLQSPLEAINSVKIPGLRLVPYRSVGKDSGMLLAKRMKGVRIGNWKGDPIVAFAPEGLGNDGTYQALTGGYV
ncbi:MAG: sigma-E processing peptidase SpoIIGA [Oscillospiraceae bacterium]|nr:sigma-E processing peptidase SpoIIGA [Oscillospiraceae bacterium]